MALKDNYLPNNARALHTPTSIVTCITIIDTIILTIYTNNAYIFDTYLIHTYLPNNAKALHTPTGM
jgi:hypothetical protein